jgi:hypothetical protein
VILSARLAQSSVAKDDSTAEEAVRKKRDWLLQIDTTNAAEYTIHRDTSRREKVELRRDPVDAWTNPIRKGAQDGAVFVWTCPGRAEVIGSIFRSRPTDRAISTTSFVPCRSRCSTYNDRALHQAAEFARRRGMVVILSDLFGDLDTIVDGLDHLRYHTHEVTIWHIMDPIERDRSVDGHIRFHDLESGETLITQAEAIRQAYGQAAVEWRQALELECRKRAIDRIELTTTDAPDTALLDYLVKRAKTF